MVPLNSKIILLFLKLCLNYYSSNIGTADSISFFCVIKIVRFELWEKSQGMT